MSEEKFYRALVISDLVTIHQKTGIGSGAAIVYLYGGGYKEIAHTIVNGLSIVLGIVCNSAKSSCAAKIAAGVDAGILGYYMYKNGQQFRSGDGIVKKGVEANISNIGKLAKDGMKETDKEIIKLMMDKIT